MIYKTKLIPLNCTKSDYNYLLGCNRESAKVWNSILEIEKDYRQKNEDKWISQNELQTAIKGIAYLHAKGIQQVNLRYVNARKAALRAKNGNGTNNKYPHRKKQFMNTIWDFQAIQIKGNIILLTKPMITINGKRKLQKPVRCFTKDIPDNIAEIELIYKDKLYLSIKYKEQSDYLQIQSNNHASIDLGEIHAITSIDSCGNAIIITGRKLRAIKFLRNKQQAELRKKISKTKSNSKQNLKYRKALKNLAIETDKKILDAIHKISKLYTDYCIENNISTVYYGDLDSATRNTKKRLRGTKVSQKLAQWNYGELVLQLNNKLSRYGIQMVKVKEYYTSQTCPSCETRNKPTNRRYLCNCGYEQHRDIVGSINILNENAGTSLKYYSSKSIYG